MESEEDTENLFLRERKAEKGERKKIKERRRTKDVARRREREREV